jgi:hypothetical protein
MFKKYRPAALGNGNGAAEVAEPIVAQNATKAPPIERKPGQENSSTFWNMFASGDRDRLAERETAIYVVRTIVGEVLGAHRVGQVNFEDGDITVDDVLNAIDRKVGVGNAAGWQRLQTRAGIKPGPGAWWHRHVEQEMSKKKEKNRHVAASFDSGKFEAFSSGSWQALSGTELHRASRSRIRGLEEVNSGEKPPSWHPQIVIWAVKLLAKTIRIGCRSKNSSPLSEGQEFVKVGPEKYSFEDKFSGDLMRLRGWMKTIPENVIVRVRR